MGENECQIQTRNDVLAAGIQLRFYSCINDRTSLKNTRHLTRDGFTLINLRATPYILVIVMKTFWLQIPENYRLWQNVNIYVMLQERSPLQAWGL